MDLLEWLRHRHQQYFLHEDEIPLRVILLTILKEVKLVSQSQQAFQDQLTAVEAAVSKIGTDVNEILTELTEARSNGDDAAFDAATARLKTAADALTGFDGQLVAAEAPSTPPATGGDTSGSGDTSGNGDTGSSTSGAGTIDGSSSSGTPDAEITQA